MDRKLLSQDESESLQLSYQQIPGQHKVAQAQGNSKTFTLLIIPNHSGIL